jgi:hypothetical protein
MEIRFKNGSIIKSLNVDDIIKSKKKGFFMSGKLDFDTIEIISIEAYHNDEYQGLEIVWNCNFGFGTFQYDIVDNKFEIVDDEYMGLDFAQAVLDRAMKINE